MADTWAAINSLIGSRFSNQANAQTALEKALNASNSRLGQLYEADGTTTRTAVAADIIDIMAMTLRDIVENNEDYDARLAADAAAKATTAALKPA
tara:strand:+ start:211 stop:495 length:285 start_codon:yes stop_codon:yes gene_type:complete